jgi:hypothetical protein
LVIFIMWFFVIYFYNIILLYSNISS